MWVGVCVSTQGKFYFEVQQTQNAGLKLEFASLKDFHLKEPEAEREAAEL